MLFCSLSGHRVTNVTPNLHFYCATKYAVTAITEGLRQELRDKKSNIKVTVSSAPTVVVACIPLHMYHMIVPQTNVLNYPSCYQAMGNSVLAHTEELPQVLITLVCD